MTIDLARRRIQESIAVHQLLLDSAAYLETVAQVAAAIARALANGGKVMFFGNGGSAADAQHLAAELTGRYLKERPSFAGMTLTANTSSLTAIGNDYSFDDVFARQLQGLGAAGDVAVGISTSGNSRNVLNALRAAQAKGIVTVGLTGSGGGALASAADYCLCVPSADTPRVQEGHILTGHIICELVENALTAPGSLS